VIQPKANKNRANMTLGRVRKTEPAVAKALSEPSLKKIPLSNNAFVVRLAQKPATRKRFKSTRPGTRNHAAKEKKPHKTPAPRNSHLLI
jgi:hypothetical protein